MATAVVAVGSIVAAPASASVTLGATDADFAAATDGGTACPTAANCSIWQHSHPPGRSSAIQFDGIVVRWRIRPSGLIAAQNATTSLRLITPGTSPMPWGAEGPSMEVPDAPDLPATISDDVRMPIAKGQGIAPQFQNLSGGNVFVAFRAGTGGNVRVVNPAPPPGGTADGVGSMDDRLLAVAADVETDADRDGFGDETQDGCPTDAGTQGACAPPDPGDVAPPELAWCGKAKQKLNKRGAVRACVQTSELAAIEATAVLSIGRKQERAKPISLPATRGGAAPGAAAYLDLKLDRNARRRVGGALEDGRRVSGVVVVTGTDAAGNRGEVEATLVGKG